MIAATPGITTATPARNLRICMSLLGRRSRGALGYATLSAVDWGRRHTDRCLLAPLADRHLELEVELDSDPEVLRFNGV
jgi:hypothetical protein